jgi:hypothetical protein
LHRRISNVGFGEIAERFSGGEFCDKPYTKAVAAATAAASFVVNRPPDKPTIIYEEYTSGLILLQSWVVL